MELKTKQCKGVGLGKGYGCNKLVLKRTYGLCDRCYYDWLQASENGRIKLEKAKLKGSQIAKKKAIQKDKEEIQKLKDKVENWKDKLQKEVQLIARLIDKGLTCLARGTNGQIHGGHIFAKGGHSEMRFNLHNIHRQSAQSNKWQNDDGLMREKLAYEYGQDYLDFVSNLRKYEVPKLSNKEYKIKYEIAHKIALGLQRKSNYQQFGVKERIELRNMINIELGIYSLEQCVFHKK